MSSASSYSSELTGSTSSLSSASNAAELASQRNGESSATDLLPTAEGTSSTFSLSDSNERSWFNGDAKGGAAAAAADDSDLLPWERIHRYIDQCVPPDLIAHQRATDGRVLTRLCDELVQLGGPEAWAARLPSDIFCGSVQTASTADDADDGGLPACIFDGALYCSEDVPPTWAEDMRSKGVTELPAGKVPWESLTRHLHQLTIRLNGLITRSGGHAPCYTLPFRLQARLTPVLYAWATHWPLVQANVRCWESVVRAFHAACGAHQPPKAAQTASATTTSPTSAPPSPLLAECTVAEADALLERVGARARYSFTLPWKPLAALFLAVLEPENSRLVSWSAMVAVVRRELPALCRRASPFFAPEAVDGLWGLVCSDLQRSSRGVAALSLFVQLVPYRHLCHAQPPLRRDGDGDDKSDAALCLTARASQILRFLLVEAAAWSSPPPLQPLSPSLPAAAGENGGPRRHSGKRRRASPPLLLPWRTAVVSFVGALAKAHPGVAPLDADAETLVTTSLSSRVLPIDSAAGMTGATAAAAVSRVVRGGGGTAAATALHGAAEPKLSRAEWTATPYVRLLSAFPDNTNSPLWRQLERWIHATSVLVRPGLPCTPGSAAERVCECYRRLAREALRRVPKGKLMEDSGMGRRQETTSSDLSAASGCRAASAAVVVPPTVPARCWSPPTIDKFVQLFLPLAVSAFQTRARTSADFLICLLYMSPTIVLPALLKCVDAGLNSPTEVAEQRRISAVLLTHTIVTLFTDDVRFSTAAAQSARETVADYFQNCAMLLLSLISPSTPEIAFSVLTLFGVAVSYMPAAMIMRSSYEAEVLGMEYASRVIPLFTERSAEKSRPHATHQRHIEALIAALPPSALAMLVRAVLQEARNRDNDTRMSALVRMVAVVAPAAAWRCAEQTWLPVLLDASASDAEVEWAGSLLAACVSELGERTLVRAHAAHIAAAARAQLRFLTSKTRRGVAVHVTNALVASLLRPRWMAASSAFRKSRWRRGGEAADAAAVAANSGDSSPLSVPTHRTPAEAATAAAIAARTGTAAEARVKVEWPDAEADVRVAASFFNDALRDIVQVVTQARRIRVCSPAAAADVDAATLAGRFLVAPEQRRELAAPSSVAEPRCVSESACAVSPHSVLEGALEWLLRLLEIFEWIYVTPSPPVANAAAADLVVAAAKKGVHWSDINPRSAWRPVCLPDGCQPAFSRAELFAIAYQHLCLPLIDYHVLAPLQKAGVEMRPLLLPLLPALEATVPTAVAPDHPATRVGEEDNVVDWGCVRGLLRWLVLSQVECPQDFWLPRETFEKFWSKVVSRNPSCRSRKKMPLSGWASRSLLLHVEAAVAGYLPVSQETLSRTVSVLQCLTFSSHEAVRSSSLHLLINDTLVASLNAASLVVFMQRQHALTAVVLARWRTLQAEQRTASDDDREVALPFSATVAPPLSLSPSSAPTEDSRSDSATAALLPAPLALTVLHTLQESSSGTLFLIAVMTIQNLFTKAPWWGLRAWRWLMTFPEELRSLASARLLPLIRRTYEMVPPAGTTTSRSPSYVEAVVQLAGSLVTAHPTRTVVLLTLANRLYWPSQQRWVSVHVVRLLTRLAVCVHVEVRSRATELLSAMALHVSLREPRVPVYLLPRTADGALPQPSPTFLFTETEAEDLTDADRQHRRAALQAVAASLHRLADLLPLLPHFIKDRGQGFPLWTITVPESAAVASGLLILTHDGVADPRGSFVATPSLRDDLADALPPDTAAYRQRWCEVLLGGDVHAPSAGSPSPPPSVPGRDGEATSSSWVLQALTLPIERPLAGSAPEASPSSLIDLVASADDGTPASTQRVTQLLASAEDSLARWVDVHAAPHRGDDAAAAGPRVVEEDEMYRRFLSVLVVATAVVRLTAQTPPTTAENVAAVAALRTRALRLFVSVLTCLCSHAAVPHLVMRSMMVLGIATVRHLLAVEETWAIVEGVSEQLRSTLAAGPGDDGGDTWSQRQLRLLTVVLTLVQAVPLVVTAALLPRLVALVREHGRLYFMSSSDQVRQCSSRLVARLIAMGYLEGDGIAVYGQCYPAARQLLSALLATVNTQVFQGTLPLTFAQRGGGEEDESTKDTDVSGKRRPAPPLPSPFTPAITAGAPPPSQFASSPSADDVALLTTVALTVQTIPMDVFVDATDDVLMLLCYALDLSFTKVQHLHEAAEAALYALATSWLPKPSAHHLLEHLCAVCTGAVNYGVSRRSKMACTRALRYVVFRNLHRIGKYAMMLLVCDAALASLAHRDAAVRGEGSQLFAILTKVASEAQSRVMVQALCTEMRQLSGKTPTPAPTPTPASSPTPPVLSAPVHPSEASSATPSPADAEDAHSTSSGSGDPAHNRRIAVVQALGAAVLADPGTPSPYVPKLMEMLASCAREGNTECGRFAKRVFEQWWHTHREGWEQEYKKYFTTEQVNAMSDLLLAPRYYA